MSYEQMELIPLINWNNAQSAYGYLEFGYGRNAFGGVDFSKPYCENVDVLAHKLGHSLIFAEVGVPRSKESATADYGGFHESAGDLVAIVSLLHFDSVVTHLMNSSSGNLFTVNELNRVGEVSASSQIRLALNYVKMSDVGTEPHDRSQPLTGAFFDIFVEIYQRHLVADGVITQSLADASMGSEGTSPAAQDLQAQFDTAYSANPQGFKMGLLKGRDEFANLLAAAWSDTSVDYLTYAGIAVSAIRQDRILNGGKNVASIRECSLWREISLPPLSALRAVWRVERFLPQDSVQPVPTAAAKARKNVAPPAQSPEARALKKAASIKSSPRRRTSR